MKKVYELPDFINVFNSNPLDDESFYENLDSVRNSETKKLEHFCLNYVNPCTRILCSGCSGSGKTTEVYRLASSPAILQKFEVVKVDLVKNLDVSHLDYVDVVFEIMASIILHFSKSCDDYCNGTEALNCLYSYLQSTLLQSDSEDFASLGLVMQAITKIRSILKFTDTARDELRDRLRSSVGELVLYTGIVLQSFRSIFGQKRFLVIIDGLDKADLNCVKRIF